MSEITILPGAEPFFAEGNKVGVLVSHGFTGSPQSMRFLAEGYAKAGYSVALPRLTGHGTSVEDMAQARSGQWVNDLASGLNWLKERCDTFFITGLSMGGTLTVVMAGIYAGLFKGIIPINGLIHPNNPDMATIAFLPEAPAVLPAIGGDIKAPGGIELAYKGIPTPAIRELLALTAAANELLPRITCPALIITSREDHVVPPVNADYILNKLGSTDKRILWLENSYHVATLDNDKELILEESLKFVKSHQ